MLTVLKIAGLSAILSAGFVTAYEAPSASPVPMSSKVFQDRVAADLAPNVAPRVASVRLADMSGSIASADMNRAAKGDARPVQASSACAGQAWPYLSRDCIAAGEGAPVRKSVRVISLESRDGVSASTVEKAAVRR